MTRKLDPKEILRLVEKEGFEAVWQKSPRLMPKPKKERRGFLGGPGKSHPLFDLIEKMRQSFLELSFTEVSNPVILDESEVYKQYGPEAPIILDRCYYLATLPRPDIGLSKTKRKEMERFGVKLTTIRLNRLQEVFRDYKKGETESDDLVEKFTEALDVPDTKAMLIISEVFPEFTSLTPEPTTLTLRSHITTAWFLTLQALQYKMDLPIRLFTVDVRFRREQREDATHLRVHHAASCVIMDEEMDANIGEQITRFILMPFGFKKFRFIRKKVTSKYYTPRTEYEGYIYHQGMNEWIEVADYGMYNPIALAKYDLEYPVLNVGIGVERVALALYGEDDVRTLVYPQFYAELTLSDSEIVMMMKYAKEPETEEGKKLQENIISQAVRYADIPGPCEFLAYEGGICGKKVRVYLYETESGAKLLGAAAKNSVYVYDGNILGAPLKGMEDVEIIKEARERGAKTNLSYLSGIASLAAAEVEKAVEAGNGDFNIRIKIVKNLSDVNIKISEVARRYVTSKKKRIEITGPVFLGIRAEIIG